MDIKQSIDEYRQVLKEYDDFFSEHLNKNKELFDKKQHLEEVMKTQSNEIHNKENNLRKDLCNYFNIKSMISIEFSRNDIEFRYAFDEKPLSQSTLDKITDLNCDFCIDVTHFMTSNEVSVSLYDILAPDFKPQNQHNTTHETITETPTKDLKIIVKPMDNKNNVRLYKKESNGQEQLIETKRTNRIGIAIFEGLTVYKDYIIKITRIGYKERVIAFKLCSQSISYEQTPFTHFGNTEQFINSKETGFKIKLGKSDWYRR